MTKYFAQRMLGNERMSKSKFEKRFNDMISDSKFNKLADIVNTRITETISLFSNSTNNNFEYILNNGLFVETGFTWDSERFTINNQTYWANHDHITSGLEFCLSNDCDMENDNNFLLNFYASSGSPWYQSAHVGAVISKNLSKRSFNNIVKNLTKYFFALYIQDEYDLIGLEGVDSMEVQNIINLISINSLPE